MYTDIWTTQSKQKIPIKELEDIHLLNILQMLKDNVKENLTREFDDELQARIVICLQDHPCWKALKAEAENRYIGNRNIYRIVF